MKQKYFFSHIIDITDVDIPLSELHLSKKEKTELLKLSEENLQLTVIEVILSHLSEDQKKEFLRHVHAKNHEKTWELLHMYIGDVEKKISDAGKAVIERLKKDIEELKRSRK